MDRNYIVGLILIVLVFVAWMYFMGPQTQPPVTPDSAADSIAVAYDDVVTEPETREATASESPTSIDSLIAVSDTLPEQIVRIESDLYTAELSSKGAGLTSFVLKNFRYFDNGTKGAGIQMVNSDGVAVPNFRFDRSRFNLENLSFNVDKTNVELSGSETSSVKFFYTFPSGETLVKTYKFYGDKYSVDIDFELNGINTLGFTDEYEIYFEPGLEPTEKDVNGDLDHFKAYALLGKDVEQFDDFDDGNQIHENLAGVTDWISTRSKYFTVALMPRSRDAIGLTIDGDKQKLDEKKGTGGYAHVGIGLKMRLGQRENLFDSYTVYLGPLDYYILTTFDNRLDDTMDLGWTIIKPVSKFITWLLVQFHQYIPNYGVVVLIFTVLIKLVLSPLSLVSMKSMRKMQQIQPLMNEIKEKYKKDPQKMNQEVMKLYKVHKINPLGGCLPMLPQIPIFFALFTVFRSTIEFRGAPFVWWIQDLSQPDSLYILPVIMAATMFVQQKLTMKDPKQKMMVYLFPALFLWWGVSFPTGLVLYWTVYNVFSLFEAVFVHKRHIPLETQPVAVTDAKPSPKNKRK